MEKLHRLGRRVVVVAAFAVTVATTLWIARARAGSEARWSAAATWGGRVPRAGDAVVIPRGRTVVLDVSPPHLASLDIDGGLRFDERDLVLRAGGVSVHGHLAVGSAARPFAHHAEIVLDGTPEGGGTIAVSGGGRLDLHGPSRVPWTTLGATALAGSTKLVLARAVDWAPGDRIVVAPSGFAASEAEERRVVSVTRTRVELAAPLRFRHWGIVTDGVDERAEVGLLSHAVVVRSTAVSAASGTGGQVVILRGGTLVASDVEFRGLGQSGKRGRYPIHFHEVGDGSASSVVDASIDRSANRCLTIHGTNGVTVRGDVAYGTAGHCFFLEDGVERGNVFENDLGLGVRAPAADRRVLPTDARPAVFWIANPDNAVRGDRAAGSDGYGFWYDLDVAPVGLARGTPGIFPRRAALGAFADDVAHANEHDGLFVDNLRNPPNVREAPNYEPPVTVHFVRFTSYKNRRHGVWLRGRRLALDDARIADNAIGATFAAADAAFRGGIVVGESDNETGPPKPFEADFPIRGFEFYDGPISLDGVHFARFVSNRARAASALSALEYSPFFMAPTHTVRGLTFERAERVYFRPFALASADGYRSTAFRDLDGSVTGRAGDTVVFASPLLATGCRAIPDSNAAACVAPIGSLFVIDLDVPAAGIGPLRIARADTAAAIVLRGNPADASASTSFQTNLAGGARYSVTFGGRVPSRFRVAIHDFSGGETVAFSFPQLTSCRTGDAVLTARGADHEASAVADFSCDQTVAHIHASSANVP